MNATPSSTRPHAVEWIPVGIEAVLLGLLGVRAFHPTFWEGELLPSLVLGLAPGCAMRLVGRRSLGAHRFGFSVGLVTFMLFNGMIHVEALGRVFSRWELLAGGLLLVVLQPVFHAVRWGLLLSAQGIRLTYAERLRLVLVGHFFNTFVPGATGGDIFRAYYVARGRREREAAVSSVLVDRFLGLPPLVLILVVAAALNWEFLRSISLARPLLWVVGGVVIGMPLLFALAAGLGILDPQGAATWQDRIPGGRALGRFGRAMSSTLAQGRAIGTAVLVGFASHGATIGAAVLFGHAAGIAGISLTQYVLLAPIGLTFNAIPLAPGGLGQGEVAFARLFEAAQPGLGPRGAAIMVCLRLGMILVGLAGGALYALGRHNLEVALEASEQGDGLLLESGPLAGDPS